MTGAASSIERVGASEANPPAVNGTFCTVNCPVQNASCISLEEHCWPKMQPPEGAWTAMRQAQGRGCAIFRLCLLCFLLLQNLFFLVIW